MSMSLRDYRIFTYTYRVLRMHQTRDDYSGHITSKAWARSDEADRLGQEYMRIVAPSKKIADVIFHDWFDPDYTKELEIVSVTDDKIDYIAEIHSH